MNPDYSMLYPQSYYRNDERFFPFFLPFLGGLALGGLGGFAAARPFYGYPGPVPYPYPVSYPTPYPQPVPYPQPYPVPYNTGVYGTTALAQPGYTENINFYQK